VPTIAHRIRREMVGSLRSAHPTNSLHTNSVTRGGTLTPALPRKRERPFFYSMQMQQMRRVETKRGDRDARDCQYA
jgi:hypothetical protein